MGEATQAEIEAGARAINRELGCHGGPTHAECVAMDGDENCDCARVAKLVLEAARAAQRDMEAVR